jgi:hypothetical protein
MYGINVLDMSIFFLLIITMYDTRLTSIVQRDNYFLEFHTIPM